VSTDRVYYMCSRRRLTGLAPSRHATRTTLFFACYWGQPPPGPGCRIYGQMVFVPDML